MTDDTTVPRTGNVLDLDALEAQRREGRGDALEVQWRGTTYRLPVELPMEAVDQLATMADVPEVAEDAAPEEAAKALRAVSKGLDGGLAVLFCGCAELPEKRPDKPGNHEPECPWVGFSRTRPSLETRMALVEGVWAAYGVTLGEALAPAQQQPAGGRRSAQTSSGGMGSTPADSTAGGVKQPADRQPKKRATKAPAKKAATKKAASSRKRAG